MISGTCWIRRDAAASIPDRFKMTEEQYRDILRRTTLEIEDAKKSLAQIKVAKKEKATDKDKAEHMAIDNMEDDMKKFNLDAYSDGDEESEAEESEGEDFIHAMSNIDEVALGDDEYLSINPDEEEEHEEEEEEEADDLRIRPTDNLLVATRTEDEISYLEVYVYEETEDNLYVHHDVMLSAFPLCVEWIGASLRDSQKTVGNFAAVGTFEPEIEIWNLDILETPYPDLVLGQQTTGSANKKSSKKKLPASCEKHTDAVMSLSWNKLHSILLLSGSADSTVKLWDISQVKALRSFNHHSDKVQTLQWNPTTSSVLASAAYDHTVKSFDCRMASSIMDWRLQADPESLKWNPHSPSCFAVSDEEGRVLYYDTRNGSTSEPLFTLHAHAKTVTSIDWNPSIPDCLLTASTDKTIKLWSTREQISCIVTRELEVGKAFTGSFCIDSPNLVCVAGSKGVLSVLNLLNDSAVVEGLKNQS